MTKNNCITDNLIISLLFLLIPNIIVSQNIYDKNNSIKYANYLYELKQYNQAAEEYERVVFLAPDSLEFKYLLVNSYLKGKQYDVSLGKIKQILSLLQKGTSNRQICPQDFPICI